MEYGNKDWVQAVDAIKRYNEKMARKEAARQQAAMLRRKWLEACGIDRTPAEEVELLILALEADPMFRRP